MRMGNGDHFREFTNVIEFPDVRGGKRMDREAQRRCAAGITRARGALEMMRVYRELAEDAGMPPAAEIVIYQRALSLTADVYDALEEIAVAVDFKRKPG